MPKVSKYPMQTASTPSESRQELMSGANGNTDPRALDVGDSDRDVLNAEAFPAEDILWGPPISHEEYDPTTYRGTDGKWQLDNYAGGKGGSR